jgi:hypothetical protein
MKHARPWLQQITERNLTTAGNPLLPNADLFSQITERNLTIAGNLGYIFARLFQIRITFFSFKKQCIYRKRQSF